MHPHVNHVLTTNVFPANWKVANVIPVKKRRSSINEENYRPVSILLALSKAFEKLITKQISKHFSANNLLAFFQSGSHSGRSCNTAMLKVIEDIRAAFDKGELSVIVLIDFSKAFDAVNFDIMFLKLAK